MLFQNKVQDTVNESMTSAIPLLSPIATMNTDPMLQAVYFDPKKGIAGAGIRRSVANLGALLVKLTYGPDNEVKISDRDYRMEPGTFYYTDMDDYLENGLGLPGAQEENGERVPYEANRITDAIEKIKLDVEGGYTVALNPGLIYKHMEKQKRKNLKNFDNKKVNIEFTAGAPRGQFIGKLDWSADGERMMSASLTIGNKVHRRSFHIHENSVIRQELLEENLHYLFTIGVDDKQAGKKYVNVLRPFSRGIRIAIQEFRNGIIKPGEPAYQVNPNVQYGISKDHVFDFTFMEGTDMKTIEHAPMMTVDFDVFYSLMHSLKGYDHVLMKFKNYYTGMYFIAPGDEYMPKYEAIVGPTIQHVRGRIWLP